MAYCHKSEYVEHLITLKLWSIHRELSRWLSNRGWFLLFYLSISRQRQSQGEKSHTAIGLRTAHMMGQAPSYFKHLNFLVRITPRIRKVKSIYRRKLEAVDCCIPILAGLKLYIVISHKGGDVCQWVLKLSCHFSSASTFLACKRITGANVK